MKTKVWDMFLVTLSYLHLYSSQPYKVNYPHINQRNNLSSPKIISLSCNLFNLPTLEDSSDHRFDITFLSLEDSDLGSSECLAEDIISLEPSFDRNNGPLALCPPPSLLDLIHPKV